jgi:hypothetical protein
MAQATAPILDSTKAMLNARALVCPEELAKADMRPFRRDSAFDPLRKSVWPKCCDAQHSFSRCDRV